MGVVKIPSGSAGYDERVLPEKVWFHFYRVDRYPLSSLNGKLDKDVTEMPWLLGLLEDVRQAGKFRNPVVVWNHHANRLTGKQPKLLLRAGSNRVWCAEQLLWTHIPAIVSVDPADQWALGLLEAFAGVRIETGEVQCQFADGGNIWANEWGWGLLRAKKPEITYADFKATAAQRAVVRPTYHQRTKILNPLENS